jgi:hypothetical protein
MRTWLKVSTVGWLAVAVLTFNLLGAPQADATIYRFDMNTATSATQQIPLFTGVQTTTVYSGTVGYGWDNSTGLSSNSQNPGTIPLKELYQDFNRAENPHTFKVDLANGDYTVKLYFFSTSLKDNIQVFAEGDLKLADFYLPANTPMTQTFTTKVTDSQLDLTFQKIPGNPGTSQYWIINGIEIFPVPLPSTVLLLGSGLVGLGLWRYRRKNLKQ